VNNVKKVKGERELYNDTSSLLSGLGMSTAQASCLQLTLALLPDAGDVNQASLGHAFCFDG